MARKFLYYEIEFTSTSFNKLLFWLDTGILLDKLFKDEITAYFLIEFWEFDIVDDEAVLFFYTDEDIVGCLIALDDWIALELVFNYGLKTFYWVSIFVWVTFPVT